MDTIETKVIFVCKDRQTGKAIKVLERLFKGYLPFDYGGQNEVLHEDLQEICRNIEKRYRNKIMVTSYVETSFLDR